MDDSNLSYDEQLTLNILNRFQTDRFLKSYGLTSHKSLAYVQNPKRLTTHVQSLCRAGMLEGRGERTGRAYRLTQIGKYARQHLKRRLNEGNNDAS